MNYVYTVLAVGLVLLAIVKLTLDKIESVKYRNDLKARKAERLAALARKEKQEREEDMAKQAFISTFLQR